MFDFPLHYSEATEKRAKKEAKALQIRMALKLQRVFRGFRIRRRIAFHRVRVKEVRQVKMISTQFHKPHISEHSQTGT